MSLTKNESGQFVVTEHEPSAPTSALQILEAAVRGGITGENVAVVKEILAMRREELAFQNKKSFNSAFFDLKKEIAGMDFYADKAAKDYDGNVMYHFCSEAELSAKLEPVLFKHGFAMMFGQRQENERVVAEVTLIHQDGHEEKREYAVRLGATNKMKDATQADAGSTTSAWRNLVIKLFGLKSRISDNQDARNEGGFITAEKALYLEQTVKEVRFPTDAFFRLAGCTTYAQITDGKYSVLFNALEEKRRINETKK